MKLKPSNISKITKRLRLEFDIIRRVQSYSRLLINCEINNIISYINSDALIKVKESEQYITLNLFNRINKDSVDINIPFGSKFKFRKNKVEIEFKNNGIKTKCTIGWIKYTPDNIIYDIDENSLYPSLF